MSIIESADPWALPAKPRKRPDRVTVYRGKPTCDRETCSQHPGWRWRLRDGGNWRILAVSGEAYTKRAHCVRMARRLFPAAELVVEP